MSDKQTLLDETDERRCYDKRGIPIERGDIVKVLHFVGHRGKRHYMFKQCLGVGRYPSSPEGWRAAFFSHLNFGEIGDNNGPYHVTLGDVLTGYEIVQSIKCDHENRPHQALGKINAMMGEAG